MISTLLVQLYSDELQWILRASHNYFSHTPQRHPTRQTQVKLEEEKTSSFFQYMHLTKKVPVIRDFRYSPNLYSGITQHRSLALFRFSRYSQRDTFFPLLLFSHSLFFGINISSERCKVERRGRERNLKIQNFV